MSKINLTGQKFGSWTVLSGAERDKYNHIMWFCQCDCGTQRVVNGNSLRRGDTKSCGCLHRELMRTIKWHYKHGMTGTPTHTIWINMRQRCNNQKNTSYKNYGGRGIKVCERWNKFKNFYADMGECPKGLTIERRDNSKGYSPQNCCFATQTEQQSNTRRTRIIKYGGKVQCLSAWAEELSIGVGTLWYRLKHYPPQIAFNM